MLNILFSILLRTIKLSVDIDNTARELISLLEKASKFQRRMASIINYKTNDNKILSFHATQRLLIQIFLLIPTLDIEIIWQTHLLRPEMYREDCMRLFHRIIDHSLLTNEVEQIVKEQAFFDTCQLYNERFGEEYCPLPEGNEPVPPKYCRPMLGKLTCLIPDYLYWDKTHFTFPAESSTNYDDNPFSFSEADIILDGNWLDLCRKFMTKMVLQTIVPRDYRNLGKIDLRSSALKRLKKSYERFLYMATKYPPSNGYGFVHPTYAVMIIYI